MYVLLILQIYDAVPGSVFPQFMSESILMHSHVGGKLL